MLFRIQRIRSNHRNRRRNQKPKKKYTFGHRDDYIYSFGCIHQPIMYHDPGLALLPSGFAFLQ